MLTALEWHTQTTRNRAQDPWYNGRFINEWADPQALEVIPVTFATYGAADMWRALFATLDLFRHLAMEIAEHLRYTYPIHRSASD